MKWLWSVFGNPSRAAPVVLEGVGTPTISEPSPPVYCFRNDAARLPAALAASPRFLCAGLISPSVRGVLLDTRREGLQYVDPRLTAPQGLPVLVSTHFSCSHLRREAPSSPFFVVPSDLRHLAIAWLARADGKTLYFRLIFW